MINLKLLKETVAFLDRTADMLDRWARESRTGGWSTHQVKANGDLADDCRRQAAELRGALRKLP